ncbi:MAG: DUF6527 family protein [Akkermansiaceae bacterium]
MARTRKLTLEFVKSVPEKPLSGTLYVSMEYATCVHLCCCGCGNEVVTPLSPPDWTLIFNGESITLHPSVGNWSFQCRSHYWIRSSRVQWANDMTDEKIKAGREFDRWNRTRSDKAEDGKPNSPKKEKPRKNGFWKNFRGFFE